MRSGPALQLVLSQEPVTTLVEVLRREPLDARISIRRHRIGDLALTTYTVDDKVVAYEWGAA